jgi:phosphoribosylcarboxyaminoimidazole (NCAIR) mutase
MNAIESTVTFPRAGDRNHSPSMVAGRTACPVRAAPPDAPRFGRIFVL